MKLIYVLAENSTKNPNNRIGTILQNVTLRLFILVVNSKTPKLQ